MKVYSYLIVIITITCFSGCAWLKSPFSGEKVQQSTEQQQVEAVVQNTPKESEVDSKRRNWFGWIPFMGKDGADMSEPNIDEESDQNELALANDIDKKKGWFEWMPFVGNKSPQMNEEEEFYPIEDIPEITADVNIDKGRVIMPAKLQDGGKVLLVPFRAGQNVESSKELDKIGYRMIQGLSIPLKDNRPYFDILVNLDQDSPDFIIDGYFISKKESSTFLSKWFFKKKKYHLGIEGKMMDAYTKEVLVTFNETVESNDPDEDFMYLGFKAGQNIGQFIQSGIEKKEE